MYENNKKFPNTEHTLTTTPFSAGSLDFTTLYVCANT